MKLKSEIEINLLFKPKFQSFANLVFQKIFFSESNLKIKASGDFPDNAFVIGCYFTSAWSHFLGIRTPQMQAVMIKLINSYLAFSFFHSFVIAIGCILKWLVNWVNMRFCLSTMHASCASSNIPCPSLVSSISLSSFYLDLEGRKEKYILYFNSNN